MRTLQLRLGFAQFDFIWRGIDLEQQVASANDIAVLKTNLSERAADLRPQFNAFHCRELAQELQSRSDLSFDRCADVHSEFGRTSRVTTRFGRKARAEENRAGYYSHRNDRAAHPKRATAPA
jgi:hypothetical protein